jgi:hypothetical protein
MSGNVKTMTKEPPRRQRRSRSALSMAIMGFVGTGVLVCGLATAASATLPAGTTVKAKLQSGTDMIFKGDIDSIPITVTCTSFSASGKVPSSPSDSVTLSSPPTISGCTDSSGGTDTITTTGTWKLSETSTAQKLKIPQDGATFKSSVLSGCTITAAPSGPAKVKGAYNDKNTDTVTNASIPTSGSGCTSTTATTTATIVEKPAPGPPPF